MNKTFFATIAATLTLHFASGLARAQGFSPSMERVLPVMGSVVPAKYPSESKAAKEQGTVKLRVAVDASGWTTDAKVLESSGFPRLDSAALDAARNWRYRPGKVAGVPTAMSVNVPVRFVLDSPNN